MTRYMYTAFFLLQAFVMLAIAPFGSPADATSCLWAAGVSFVGAPVMWTLESLMRRDERF